MLAQRLRASLAIFPRTRREGLEFLLDLSPLIGILVFHESPRNLFLLLGIELLFLEGWIAFRILTHGLTRIFTNYFEIVGFPRDFFQGLVFLFSPIPLLGILAALLAVLLFNYVPFIFLETLLVAAASEDPNPRGHLVSLIRRLSPSDLTTMSLLLLPTARRYALWAQRFLVDFIRKREWQSGSYHWCLMGLPQMGDHAWNRLIAPLEKVSLLTLVISLFLFALLLNLFAQKGGFIGVIFLKAFLELWIDRGIREALKPAPP